MRTFTTVPGLGTILALCIASMPASSQTTNWTGFYFGGNFGLGAGHNGTQDQTTLTPAGAPGVTSPGVINPIAASLYTQTPINILGGGQAGYNWQSAQWVLGTEADFDWTNQRSTSSSDSFLSAGPSGNGLDPSPAARQSFINDQTIRWLSTFRARAGRAEGTLPDKIDWKQAVLAGDPSKPGIYVVLTKWLPNNMSRPHFHPNDRFITVIKGTWWMGTGTTFDPASTVPVPAGTFVTHFGKRVHYDGAKDGEVVLLITGEGPATSTLVDRK